MNLAAGQLLQLDGQLFLLRRAQRAGGAYVGSIFAAAFAASSARNAVAHGGQLRRKKAPVLATMSARKLAGKRVEFRARRDFLHGLDQPGTGGQRIAGQLMEFGAFAAQIAHGAQIGGDGIQHLLFLGQFVKRAGITAGNDGHLSGYDRPLGAGLVGVRQKSLFHYFILLEIPASNSRAKTRAQQPYSGRERGAESAAMQTFSS